MKRFWLLSLSLLFVLAACGPKPTAAPTATAWPPAGVIAFSKTKGGEGDDIYIVNTDGTGLTLLASGPNPWNEHPSWSPDGTRIIYHSGVSNSLKFDLFVINADGSGQAQRTQSPPASQWPAWSPDGTKIAFTALPTLADVHIKLMNPDGSDQVVLMNGAAVDILPAWASNGDILFIRKPDLFSIVGGDVFSVKPDGSGLTQLTKVGFVGGYALSPDGTRLVYYETIKHQIVLITIEAGGTSLTLLDQSTVFNSFPKCPSMAMAWSPDGGALALACSDNGAAEGDDLYIVKADGSRLTKVPNTAGALDPVWKPK